MSYEDEVRRDHPKAAFHWQARGFLDGWADDEYRASLNSIGHELVLMIGEAAEREALLTEDRKRQEMPDNVRALDSARRHSDPTQRPSGCA